MRGFKQLICVLLIAIGGGLLAYSSKLEPHFNPADPTSLVRYGMDHENKEQHSMASLTGGFGISFMLLGTLGLVLPWINKLAASLTGELSDSTARTVALIAVWFSITIILTFGVFSVPWVSTGGLIVALLIVVIICTAATITSAIVFGWKPWLSLGSAATATDQPKSPSVD